MIGDSTLSTDDFLKFADKVIKVDYDSRKQFAKKHEMSASYVSDVLLGKRTPGEKFLRAIGAQKVVSYRLVPMAK